MFKTWYFCMQTFIELLKSANKAIKQYNDEHKMKKPIATSLIFIWCYNIKFIHVYWNI